MSPAAASPIHGVCDPAFARVREALRDNFEERDEVGAAVAVWIGGRPVLDLWGGHVDQEHTRPWRQDTLVNIYSVGKGVVAVLALALVARGRLDPDATVAASWPEFGAAGKGGITLRELMAHRAGLPALREPMANEVLADWSRVVASLAAQEPWWLPGGAHGYHVNTFGFLVGEVLRRAAGASCFSDALREFVTRPVAADFHVGLNAADEARCAGIVGVGAALSNPEIAREAVAPASGDAATDQMKWAAYFNPPAIAGFGVVNSSWWRRLAIPSTNGHATARGVAAIYAATLNPAFVPRLLLEDAIRPVSDGMDVILDRPTRFGLGFQLAQESRPIGPNPRAFGHFGYGGSLGFADPDAGLAFGYVMNRPGDRWQSPRTNALIEAVYASL